MLRRLTLLIFFLLSCPGWSQEPDSGSNWVEKDGSWYHNLGIVLTLPKRWKPESSDGQVYVHLSEPGPELPRAPASKVILRADAERSWQGPDRVLWLRYLDGRDAARWLPAFSPAAWSWDAASEALLCQGSPEVLEQAEALLLSKDVPPRTSTRFCAFPVAGEQEARERASGLESWLAGQGQARYVAAPYKLAKGLRGHFRRSVVRLGFTDHVNTVGYLTDGRQYLLIYSQAPSGRADALAAILKSVRLVAE